MPRWGAGGPAPRQRKKANKVQISLSVSRELLAKIDLQAARMGQSRAAVIGLAMYEFLGVDEV